MPSQLTHTQLPPKAKGQAIEGVILTAAKTAPNPALWSEVLKGGLRELVGAALRQFRLGAFLSSCASIVLLSIDWPEPAKRRILRS